MQHKSRKKWEALGRHKCDHAIAATASGPSEPAPVIHRSGNKDAQANCHEQSMQENAPSMASFGVLKPRPTDLKYRCSPDLFLRPRTRFSPTKIVACCWKDFSVCSAMIDVQG